MESFDLDEDTTKKRGTKDKNKRTAESQPRRYELRKRSVHEDTVTKKPQLAASQDVSSSDDERTAAKDTEMSEPEVQARAPRKIVAAKKKLPARKTKEEIVESSDEEQEQERDDGKDEEVDEESDEEVPVTAKKSGKGGKKLPARKQKKAEPKTASDHAFDLELKRSESVGPREIKQVTLSPKEQATFLQYWGTHISEVQSELYPKKGAARKKKILNDGDTGHRNLDRVAWVLDKLAPSAVCVAVLVAKDGVYAYANDSSGLAAAIQTLNKYKASNGPTKQQLQEFVNLVYKGRKPKKDADPEQRLARACETLREIGLELKPHVNKTDDKHAEIHALDVLQKLDKTADGKVGISKLCCAKCYMALHAIGRTDLVTGAHFKTAGYGKWAVPQFLTSDAVMTSFLGKHAFAMYKANPDAVMRLISNYEPTGVTGSSETDPVFSDEEM